MSIRRGTVSCARFRIEGTVPKEAKKWLTKALKAGAFEPINPKGDEERAAGFVDFEDGSPVRPSERTRVTLIPVPPNPRPEALG